LEVPSGSIFEGVLQSPENKPLDSADASVIDGSAWELALADCDSVTRSENIRLLSLLT
jgi:hypothetical protein